MTHLRQLMLDELQRRNYSPSTAHCYLHAVEDFAKYFHRSPERLGLSHIRQYQVHLFRDRKLSPGTIQIRLRLCASCSSRPFGDPTCSMRFPSPSALANCQLCLVQKKSRA